ncbi:MAG: hypothetical protein ACRD4I_12195, partial [Candidatus Angelobacter sp.]
TMTSKLNLFAALFCAACVALTVGTETVHADDFGNIVHQIEAGYHVHRNHRFLMGCAGLVVKFWHVGGVKSLKLAIFEDQHLQAAGVRDAAGAQDGAGARDAADVDRKLDEIVQSAGHGWQPLVRSYSRHSGDHTYIYAQEAGKDLKLLLVNVESSEAEVIQVKVDPQRLDQFIDENVHHARRHGSSAGNAAMSFF